MISQNQESKADHLQLQAKKLARERAAQKQQRRRDQFEVLLKECKERKTICCCALLVDLSSNQTWMRNNSDSRSYLKELLRDQDESQNPYVYHSKEDAQDELVARGIPFPELDSRYAYRCALQAADGQRQIDFLRLPKDVRLMVYEIVISEDPIKLARPALLAANKQIRDEASPIFFRSTHFRLDLDDNYYLPNVPKFTSLTRKWLNAIGPDGIKELRHISIASRSEEYNIDLSCSDAGQWSTTLRSQRHAPHPLHSRQSCPRRKVKTLAAWLADARKAVKEDVEDMTRRGQDPARLKAYLKHKESAQEWIQVGMDIFSLRCGEGKSVKPTLQGLEVLVDAIIVKDYKARSFVKAVYSGRV